MSKSLVRKLTLGLTPIFALALLLGYLFADEATVPRTIAYGSALSLTLLASFILLHRLVGKPLGRLYKTLLRLREGGPLPEELPLKRTDEIGRIAREVAFLAGDRNTSEARRHESEGEVAALSDAISGTVLRIDRDGLLLAYQAPRHARPFLSSDVVGKKLRDVFPETMVDRSVQAMARVLGERSPEQFELEVDVGDGQRTYDVRFAAAGGDDVLATFRDTTDERETASSCRRLDAILDATFDPVITITPEGAVRYVNPVAARLFGLEDSARNGLELACFLPDWAREQIEQTAIPATLEDGSWNGESAFVGGDDVEIPVSLTAVSHENDAGEVELITLIGRDQSERKRFDDHLLFLADHDPLTSLYTRRRFVEELGREIARSQRTGSGGAILLLDLDDLKYVNDSLGHTTGDKLLTGLANLLRKHVRANDMLARLDGDEFAFLITEMRPSRIELVIERLLKAVRNHFVDTGDQPIGVTASAGIAFFPEHGATAEELLSRADQALARAKTQGRDQFVVFKPDEDWQAEVDSRLSGEKLIREALVKGRFVLHAQPILDLKTNSITQFEILLRMLGENDELMPPASFLGTAERFGLIRSIDRWVVRNAIQLMGRQKKAGHNVRLSVNLSGKSLGDFELTTLIEQELSDNDVNPRLLTFEITESTAISDTNRSKLFAIALKQIGCHLALDDFGVGHSSFHKLKHLPVDYLKIDGSFIRDLPKNKIDQHLVRAMVELARALRKRTVAEFVGSEETLELLRTAGVDFGQGYHIGKPEAVETFLPREATS